MQRAFGRLLAAVIFICAGGHVAAQETIQLRIASGHTPLSTYVFLMQNFFVPEVTRRVAARSEYQIEFIEGYGGTMVRTADTLEGVKAGTIDIGGYCFCFEPSNLPLHAFQVMLPFGSMSPVTSLRIARDVYNEVPFMATVFESKHKQKLIALMSDNGHNLGTNFEWNDLSDLKGRKLAGAGLNLKWVEAVGAVPILSSLRDAYAAMNAGAYSGWIIHPSGWLNFKLYELGKVYTEVGFGAVTWHGLTINKARFEKLPEEVQTIILEVGREYESMTGSVNAANYRKQIDDLTAQGVTVRKLPDNVRAEWAKSLASWPKEMAKELDAQGLPATQVMEAALAAAERAGHRWPVRYVVK